MLKRGIYERVINDELKTELEELSPEQKNIEVIDPSEIHSILSKYVESLTENALLALRESARGTREGVFRQVALVNEIADVIAKRVLDTTSQDLHVDNDPQCLLGILEDKDPLLLASKTASDLTRPTTSVARSFLFTGTSTGPTCASRSSSGAVLIS